MSYYHAKILNLPFDAALAAAREALAQQGFGVVTELDIHQTLQAKLGESFRPYTILGACNPRLAYEALQLEDKVGTMLPCNVVVQQRSDESTEVGLHSCEGTGKTTKRGIEVLGVHGVCPLRVSCPDRDELATQTVAVL